LPPSTVSCPAVLNFLTPAFAGSCLTPSLSWADATTSSPSPTCVNYTVVRTWTASLGCNAAHTATTSQKITVRDTVAPTFTPLPPASTVYCPSPPSFVQAVASDGCSATTLLSPVTSTTTSGCSTNYTAVQHWTAIDSCGNTASTAQTVVVVDAPVLGALTSSTVSCSSPLPGFSTPTVSAGQGCSAITSPLASATSSATYGCVGNYTLVRRWTATNRCGNTATTAQTITVRDTTAPVLGTLPAARTIACPLQPVFATPSVSDDCTTTPTLTSR
jgi:hypothetical protein